MSVVTLVLTAAKLLSPLLTCGFVLARLHGTHLFIITSNRARTRAAHTATRAQFLFLGEVLIRAPATSEESADGAAAFLLGETGAGAAAARAEAFLFLDLVAGAAATGTEASSAAFLLGEVLAGVTDGDRGASRLGRPWTSAPRRGARR
jgi:hypothetical protein